MSSSPLSNFRKSTSKDEEVNIQFDTHNIRKAAMVLRALNHNLRQEIIKLIFREENITVTEIYHKLGLEQSVASQHLAILRKAGILLTNRDGKHVHYTINTHRIDEIGVFAKHVVG